MGVKVAGELAYGGGTLAVELEIDVSGAVALIGPNLTGKSLLLLCIFSRYRRLNRGPHDRGRSPLQPLGV
jgi:ABC-type enterochelin transport system ATPase subunit